MHEGRNALRITTFWTQWPILPLAYSAFCFMLDSHIRLLFLCEPWVFILSGESLSRHKDKPFSTKDADHDTYHASCSDRYHGAWWYTDCHDSNLNGQYYQEGEHVSYGRGISWNVWTGDYVSLKVVTMKVRPAAFTPGENEPYQP